MSIPITKAIRGLLLVAVALLGAACATSLTPAEQMMWSTYLIATPKGVGTCIIVNRKDRSAPGGVRPVLVTSAHVLSTAPKGPFYLVCRHQESGQSPLVDILEIDPPSQTAPVFVRHPRYDVAAMEIQLPLELVNEVALPSFLDENAIAEGEGDLHPGDDVSVLGFPSVFPGTKGAFAVLRSARIASYSAGPPSEHRKFMINTNVYSGDSGGPVFRNSRRGRPQLVGILTERIGKKEGSVPLAVALDASVIAETLELAAARGRQERSDELPFSVEPEAHSVRLLGPLKSLRELVRANRRSD